VQLQFGLSSYQRGKGGLPELPVINLRAESAPTETKGVILLSRPGVVSRGVTMGAGPVKALFKADGVLDSALYGVSGTKLYREGAEVGTLNGAGPWSLAGYAGYLFAAGGQGLWTYDGTTVASVAFPDAANVIKVLVADSRAIALRGDTQKYYYSDPLETDIEALDFTSAESQPDRLLDAVFINGVLWLGGAETIEPHMATGGANLPFQQIRGRVINRGVKATGCMTEIGGVLVWVSDENQVCYGEENAIFSNEGLEARIGRANRVRLFTFMEDGSEFLALRLGFEDGTGETQVWSPRSKGWSEYQTYGRANWAAQCFAGGVFGSAYGGDTLAWGTDYSDALATDGILERRFRAGTPINGGGVTVDNLRVRCEVGQTPYLSGTYREPEMEMRLSEDGGRTFGAWDGVSLEQQGSYGEMPEWRGLGWADSPAFLSEFRVTAPVSVRVSDVLINEAW
jgi:hypothetical protein